MLTLILFINKKKTFRVCPCVGVFNILYRNYIKEKHQFHIRNKRNKINLLDTTITKEETRLYNTKLYENPNKNNSF